MRNPAKPGFTLIELLVVIAIIAILASILIPVTGAVRRAVFRSRTQAQFNQYAVAFEQFKTEYGYYPRMGVSGSGDTRFNLGEVGRNDVFIETLSGRQKSGDSIANEYAKRANPKRISFYTFSQSEFAPDEVAACGETVRQGAIVDGFGNPNIVVVVDSDRNGVICKDRLPGNDDINAGVVFFSDTRNCDEWKEVRSWN
jgi:prepilin-type N-terminal cleavage/methylation domain-containing protein